MDDVRNLLQSVGLSAPEFEYREVATIERWQAAAQRWPLLGAVNRALLERSLMPPPTRPPQRNELHRAHCIAFVSLHGGSGRTTLSANLAGALAQKGRTALAIELDPQGGLAPHFALEPEDCHGAFTPAFSPLMMASWLSRFRGSGAAPVPFGRLTAGLQTGLEAACARDPNWLHKRLSAVIPEECEFAVLDLPAASHPLFRAAIASADTVICLLSPEPAAYATLPQLEALLDECAPRPAHYLMNGLDARRAFDRDAFASLRGTLGARVLPFAVHKDPSVPLALARRRLIMQEAADSQVVAELSRLADCVEGWAAPAGAQAPVLQAVR